VVKASLHALAFAPDGATLYAASGTHLGVLRWDLATGKELPPLGRHDGGLNGLALSADGRLLAAVTMGGSLYLWELATGQTRFVAADLGYATVVAFSPDGRLLALANRGNHTLLKGEEVVQQGPENRAEVRLVRVADGKVVHRFTGHTGGVGCLGFSSDGRTLASGGQDTSTVLWDVASLNLAVSPPAAAPGPEEMEELWAGLGQGAGEAQPRMARLLASPAATVRFLAGRLKPVAGADPERVRPLLRQLDSDDFAEREAATRELEKLGEAAEPVLREALKSELSIETRRRVEGILEGLNGPGGAGRRRTARALEVLERLGDRDARALLRRLSEGTEGAWLTDEARAALRRLDRLGPGGQ